MLKRLFFKLFILSIAVNLFSCASPKKIVYFQDVEGLKVSDTIINYVPAIEIGDLLSINVSAIDAEAALPFNLYETPVLGNGASSAKPLDYLVDVDGEIHFPVLGKLKVAGLTTKELNTKLTDTLKTYIVNPIVNIRLTNFKVTVLGEVKNPGTYAVPNERISIVDALGLAGDLTVYGKRQEVSLIREENGKRTFTTIDLTNKELFSSPYYYLSQNDIIYVEPNNTKVNSSSVGPNTGVILSVVSILISVSAILFVK